MASGSTTVPVLVLVRTSPLAVSTLTASRTADRPEPSSLTSAVSVGSRSPGANSPDTIRRPRSCTSRPCTPSLR